MTTTMAKISDTDFESLRKIIYDRSGIYFQDNKRYVLESRLARRLTELDMDDFSQYVAYLSMGPYQSDEFQEMFNRITINETSFFRNEPQLNAFEQVVLPELLEARKSTKRLRLWSAACSTGEEPYTLAIMLHRSLGVRLADWHIEILGTDISEKVLNAATLAQYTAFSFRGVSPLVTKRYFKEEGGLMHLNPEIKSMVTFMHHNLKDTLAAKRLGTWDVIFCRNVMIYFDDDMKKRCINMFAEQLAKDGTLFIGHSETVKPGDAPLVPMDLRQAFAYRRQTA